MECIATDPRGGGPLDVGETYGGAVALYVGECAAPTWEGPLRGCTATICGVGSLYADVVQPLTCGGAVPCTQAAVWHHAREGCCWRVPPLSLLSLTLFRALVANYNQSIAIFTVYLHNLFTYRLGSLCERAAVRIARSRFCSAGRAEENLYVLYISLWFLLWYCLRVKGVGQKSFLTHIYMYMYQMCLKLMSILTILSIAFE